MPKILQIIYIFFKFSIAMYYIVCYNNTMKGDNNMQQFSIIPNEEHTTKSISLFADEYHESEWGSLIFTQNNEVIAIFNKNDYLVFDEKYFAERNAYGKNNNI